MVELRLRESGDAFRSDLWRGLAITDVDRDYSVSIGRMMSPIYVITHSRRQQVRTKAASAFRIVGLSPLNFLLIMHVKYKPRKCLLISGLSGSNRNTSDWLGKPRHSYAVSGLAWWDTNMVFSILRHAPTARFREMQRPGCLIEVNSSSTTNI